MLKGAINHAASVAGSLVAGYMARAAIAVPFVAGFAFATAALTLLLIDRYGHRDAYLMIAAIFALLGLLAAAVVSARERGAEKAVEARATSAKIPSEPMAEAGTAAGSVAMPFAVLGTVLTTLGPAPFLSLLGILGRNLPLVLVLGAAGAFVWPKGPRGPGIAAAPAETGTAAGHAEPAFRQVHDIRRRSMAMGTFVIAALLVGAALGMALGSSAPALPTPYFIG